MSYFVGGGEVQKWNYRISSNKRLDAYLKFRLKG